MSAPKQMSVITNAAETCCKLGGVSCGVGIDCWGNKTTNECSCGGRPRSKGGWVKITDKPTAPPTDLDEANRQMSRMLWSETQTPVGKAMKGLLDEAIRQKPWEQMYRGSGIVESYTNTGLRVWTFSDSESPLAKAMKGLLDEANRQMSRGGSGIVESYTNTGLQVWTFSETQTPVAKAMKGLLDEAIRQNPWQQM